MNRLENIFLIRHACSAANEDLTLYRTIPDHAIPLSERGKAEAVATGKAFAQFLQNSPCSFALNSMRLWYSPYVRAKQTRDGLLAGMENTGEVFRDKREHILLKEQSFGLFDGLTDAECDEKYPEESKKFDLCIKHHGRFYAKPPNGESRFDVCVRMHQFFGTIIRDAEKAENHVPNVCIISHGTTLRAFAMMWLHKEVEWFEKERNPPNCSIRRIGRDANGYFTDMGYIFPGFKNCPPDATSSTNTTP